MKDTREKNESNRVKSNGMMRNLASSAAAAFSSVSAVKMSEGQIQKKKENMEGEYRNREIQDRKERRERDYRKNRQRNKDKK